MDTARLFLGFVIGALLVFLLSYNYYFREENNEQLEQLTEENNTLIGEKNEIQKKYDELNEKYQGLNDTFEEVKKQVDYYLNASKLLQIEKYVSQNQYREAADLLLLLKNTAFTGVEKEKFDKLSQDVMPKAAQEEYNKGRELLSGLNLVYGPAGFYCLKHGIAPFNPVEVLCAVPFFFPAVQFHVRPL